MLEYARVARQVARRRRGASLSWTHHQHVADRPPAEQDEWLDRAEAQRWSIEEFRGMLGEQPALPTRRDRRRLLREAARDLIEAAQPGGESLRCVPEQALEAVMGP
jgi:hypothetical protein